MKRWMNKCVALICAALTAAACAPSSPPPAPKPSEVTTLRGTFVAPESCVKSPDGWIVVDQGCGFAQPCKQDKEARLGSAILVRPDGSRTTLVSGLREPNGAAVDVDGNLWIADGAAGEIVVRTPDGALIRNSVAGAGLLNDVAAAPWAPSTVWVSDTKTGAVHIAALDQGRIITNTYSSPGGGPNGLAPGWDHDGVVVAGLGDLALPGKPGALSDIAPRPEREGGACAHWHGGERRALAPLANKKLDGLVPFKHKGVEGYLTSAIYDVEAGKTDIAAGIAAELWFVPATGGKAELLADLNKLAVPSSSLRISAADIGVDPMTGIVCIPDLNGSNDLTDNGQGAARVFLLPLR